MEDIGAAFVVAPESPETPLGLGQTCRRWERSCVVTLPSSEKRKRFISTGHFKHSEHKSKLYRGNKKKPVKATKSHNTELQNTSWARPEPRPEPCIEPPTELYFKMQRGINIKQLKVTKHYNEEWINGLNANTEHSRPLFRDFLIINSSSLAIIIIIIIIISHNRL